MKYVAMDGTVFNDEQSCKAYEQDLKNILKAKDLDWAKLKEKQRAYEKARKDFEIEVASFHNKYLADPEYNEGLRKIFEWFISA